MEIQYTLLSDGSSDRALLPILSFLLRSHGAETVEPQWAELRRLRVPPQTLPDKIRVAVDLYHCDILFIHRDAERDGYDFRRREIHEALLGADIEVTAVCVVPVRMTEAWLLIDEGAIRRAAGNPAGKVPLNLPVSERLEDEADPKNILHKALRDASELRGRRLRDFPVGQRVHRVAELVADYSVLRNLPAFQALERDVETALRQLSGETPSKGE